MSSTSLKNPVCLLFLSHLSICKSPPRMSSVKLCLVGSAVDRVCRPHVVEVANVLDFFKSLNVVCVLRLACIGSVAFSPVVIHLPV